MLPYYFLLSDAAPVLPSPVDNILPMDVQLNLCGTIEAVLLSPKIYATGVQMNPTKKIKAAALAALLLLLPGAESLAAKAMPNFSLPSVADSSLVRSEDFKNKVLLISFFATWCPPCREEIPTFIQLQNELGQKGFSVLAFSVDDGGSKIVKELVELEKINYPVLMADEAVLAGFGGISGVPISFLVNGKGNVVKSYPGYIPHELLKQDIEAVMAETKK